MEAYVFANYGLTIFDTSRDTITLNSAGQPIDQIKNLLTITTANGLPHDGESPPRAILQPAMSIKVASLVYFVTYQVVRTPQAPTTTPEFTLTSGHLNRKIIDYETKEGEALYKRSTRSLYSVSEGKFALTSDGILPFVGLIPGNAQFCCWDIFDVPILTTVSTKEMLGHYGKITLPDIKTQANFFNDSNDRRYK